MKIQLVPKYNSRAVELGSSRGSRSRSLINKFVDDADACNLMRDEIGLEDARPWEFKLFAKPKRRALWSLGPALPSTLRREEAVLSSQHGKPAGVRPQSPSPYG